MKLSITVSELVARADDVLIFDVRKPEARRQSGYGIAGSTWHHPFDAATWVQQYRHRDECCVVYCVHGHEVSQAVAGFLRDNGIDAVFLEGGFEAWGVAGGKVERLDE